MSVRMQIQTKKNTSLLKCFLPESFKLERIGKAKVQASAAFHDPAGFIGRKRSVEMFGVRTVKNIAEFDIDKGIFIDFILCI